MVIAIVNALLVLLVAYAHWRMPDAVAPTVPFGVRVPEEREGDPLVARLKRVYRTVLVPLAVLAAAAGFLVEPMGPVYSVLPVIGFIALMYIAYYLIHRALRAAKARAGWYAGRRTASAADTGLRAEPLRYPGGYLLAAGAVIAVTLAIGIAGYPHLPQLFAVHFSVSGRPNGFAHKSIASAFWLVWLQIALTALFAGITYAILHSRQELDPASPGASQLRHQAFRRTMATMLLVLATLVNLSLLFSSLEIWGVLPAGGAFGPLAAAIPVLLGAAVVIVVTLRMGQGGSRLPAPSEQPTGYTHRDDDRYWLGGGIYINREDPAILVQRRFGVGWTLNFGHPVSWVVLAAVVALIAASAILRHR